MQSDIFRGTIPALMTPCTKAREPDFDALVRAGKQMVQAGMSAVVYCGSMGDWPLLSDEARMHGVERLVAVDVPGLGAVVGDVAWGGNWFFLVGQAPLPLAAANVAELGRAADAVSKALEAAGIRGDDGAKIDHIEFFGPPSDPQAHSRNFILCPGGAYDRSPCGTGTSAKLACLAADGKLAPGETWIQESIVGSRFAARYRPGPDGRIVPRIRGRAYVGAEATLLRDPNDPFADGMRGDA